MEWWFRCISKILKEENMNYYIYANEVREHWFLPQWCPTSHANYKKPRKKKLCVIDLMSIMTLYLEIILNQPSYFNKHEIIVLLPRNWFPTKFQPYWKVLHGSMLYSFLFLLVSFGLPYQQKTWDTVKLLVVWCIHFFVVLTGLWAHKFNRFLEFECNSYTDYCPICTK